MKNKLAIIILLILVFAILGIMIYAFGIGIFLIGFIATSIVFSNAIYIISGKK